MIYSDGHEVRRGDEVDFNGGNDKGTVVAVWNTLEEARSFGAQGPGLLIESPRFGLVEYGEDDLADDGMILIRRKENGQQPFSDDRGQGGPLKPQ